MSEMKRGISLIISFLMLFMFTVTAFGEEQKQEEASGAPEMHGKSAVLMEYETGTVLFEQNKDEALPPASVTKIMTMALVLEQVETGKIKMEDMVTTSENARHMGGTKIYLETGEQMSVYEMMMAVAVASANDAAVALGEHVSGGSEDAFVELMNAKAKELGMNHTTFQNPSGLPDDGHLTSAYDIALMSRYLLSFEQAKEFIATNIYPIREGEREYKMRNSNELIRSYDGCIGIKTGYTADAGYCLSSAATRNGLTLIAVVMGEEQAKVRNQDCEALLDYGFANFELFQPKAEAISVDPIPVSKGAERNVEVQVPAMDLPAKVVKKGETPTVEQKVTVDERLHAPVLKGQKVGEVSFTIDGEELASFDLTVKQEVKKRGFLISFSMLLKEIFG